MIPRDKLIRHFEEIVGWPYRSPGSNDRNGIDCSGAFVRAFRLEGSGIYHGSNRIIRAHCRDVRRITSVSDLEPGMAVFKGRENVFGLASAYKPGGAFYNPALPLDYYHTGLVASVMPLRIIHATTPAAKVDTAIGKWLMAGYLLGVGYEQREEINFMPEITEAVITAKSGGTVNFRQLPRDGAALVRQFPRLPLGTQVNVLERAGLWSKVSHNGVQGYIKSEFLKAANTDAGLSLEDRIASLEARVLALETNR